MFLTNTLIVERFDLPKSVENTPIDKLTLSHFDLNHDLEHIVDIIIFVEEDGSRVILKNSFGPL